MKEILLSLILLILILYFLYKNLYSEDNLVYITATIDNDNYWVRNLPDKSIAANTLSTIKNNMKKLIEYLKNNKDSYPDNLSYINNLISRTSNIYITETPKDEKYTSYTINKGEKIVFCLRTKIFDKIHDLNTLMYVVIHEMAHIACPEYGHTKLFKKIFKFLLTVSSKINIYKIINYKLKPQNYCGMTITEYLLDNDNDNNL